jgi:hypothetical protein
MPYRALAVLFRDTTPPEAWISVQALEDGNFDPAEKP